MSLLLSSALLAHSHVPLFHGALSVAIPGKQQTLSM